jgi:KUP system potassium uptake protein
VAVTLTMIITAVLFIVVARERWQWARPRTLLLGGVFLVIDGAFLAANIFKIPQGGWFPLVIGAVIFTLMTTWKRGREIVAAKLRVDDVPSETFVASIVKHPPVRVPGTAVFLHNRVGSVPPSLLANLKHNHVLHERVAFVAVETAEVPRVYRAARTEIRGLGAGFYQIILHVGFMEESHVPQMLENLVMAEISFDPRATTYFLGRVTLLVTSTNGMAVWRKYLFKLMTRNARSAALFFAIPPQRAIEIGAQVEF